MYMYGHVMICVVTTTPSQRYCHLKINLHSIIDKDIKHYHKIVAVRLSKRCV